MKRILFPYYLERSTNIEKKELSNISDSMLIESVYKIIDEEEKLNNIIIESISIMEKQYSISMNPAILKAKRKVASKKAILNLDESLDDECKEAINKYMVLYNNVCNIKTQYYEFYKKCNDINRENLSIFFKKNFDALRVLPLINKDLIYKIEKFFNTPTAQHKAQIRKFDHQLVKIMSRVLMRTSPFSYFTSICLAKINKNEISYHKQLKSFCEINNYLIKAIYDYIILQKQFAIQINYKITSFNEYEDGYLFLGQKDFEKGKVYKTVDFSKLIRKNILISKILKEYKYKSFSFYEIVNFISNLGIDKEEAEKYVFKLISNNIITPNKTIDETKGDIFKDFFEKIDYLKDDSNNTLSLIKQQVTILKKNVIIFQEADWKERFRIINNSDLCINNIEKIVNREFVHNILMYEDTYYDKPVKKIEFKEEFLEDIGVLQRYFKIFDQSLITLWIFSENFHKIYGDKKVKADNLDVYQLFANSANSLSNIWKDNFGELEIETIDKIKKITELKKNIYDLIKSYKGNEKKIDITFFIDKEMLENNELLTSEIDSATVFFQKDDNDNFVLNKIYKGQLLFFSRFIKLYKEAVNDDNIKYYVANAFGKNPVEITESFGFNANVHNQVMDKRLVLNMTDSNDVSEKDINIKDCYFYYCNETETIKLENDKYGEINGSYLGSLAYNLMPIQLRTIVAMQPSTRFDISYLNFWDKKDIDHNKFIIDHIPRIYYKNIIIIREQYLINNIYDTKKNIEELYIEVIKNFKENNLPTRFFLRPYINEEHFDFYNMGRTSLKPQYIDLSSTLLFKEMISRFKKNNLLILEEVFPNNKEDEFIYEYQIEQTIIK